MRTIKVATFVSLDGVMQAPGGPVVTGSFQMADPNEEEAARQARMRREG